MKIKIRYKIVVPFIILFLIAFFSIHQQFTSLLLNQIEAQIQNQMIDVAYTLGHTNYLRSQQIVEKMKGLIQADIMVCDTELKSISGTLPLRETQQLQNFFQKKVRFELKKDTSKFLIFREVLLEKKKYAVLIAKPEEKKNATLFTILVFPEERFSIPKLKATKAITEATTWSILLIILIGIVISLTITRPLELLSQEAQRLAHGPLEQRVSIQSSDEVGELAEAFNQMIYKLKETQENLIQAERLATLGKITARVAHEIRNPLTSIKMTIQNIKRRAEQKQPPSPNSLNIVLNEIDRLEFIIQEFLSLSQEQVIEAQQLPIHPLLEEILALTAIRMQHLKIKVIRNFDPNLETLFFDKDKLKQVVLNLVLNALNAMPNGGIITLKTAIQSEEWAEIAILDTGVGVSKETEKQLFKSFFTTRSDGTGLGLFNSQEIIKKHQGNIGYRRLEQGSEFWFTLPKKG